MICNNCNKEISEVEINMFDYNGADSFIKTPIVEHEIEDTKCIEIETSQNWCGYELSEEEQIECIICPECGAFPFQTKEVQVYDVVKVICFNG